MTTTKGNYKATIKSDNTCYRLTVCYMNGNDTKYGDVRYMELYKTLNGAKRAAAKWLKELA